MSIPIQLGIMAAILSGKSINPERPQLALYSTTPHIVVSIYLIWLEFHWHLFLRDGHSSVLIERISSLWSLGVLYFADDNTYGRAFWVNVILRSRLASLNRIVLCITSLWLGEMIIDGILFDNYSLLLVHYVQTSCLISKHDYIILLDGEFLFWRHFYVTLVQDGVKSDSYTTVQKHILISILAHFPWYAVARELFLVII